MKTLLIALLIVPALCFGMCLECKVEFNELINLYINALYEKKENVEIFLHLGENYDPDSWFCDQARGKIFAYDDAFQMSRFYFD